MGNILNFLQLGRLLDTEVEFNFQNATEDQHGNALIPKDSPGVQGVDLCAPDTFDLTQGTLQLV
jgi:hypothetical protein